ncbi:MAG: hypothetical protein OEW11_11430 [Nitrospirota bacterium]|nr:hypothetical protein [Nitrospirota bacterium]
MHTDNPPVSSTTTRSGARRTLSGRLAPLAAPSIFAVLAAALILAGCGSGTSDGMGSVPSLAPLVGASDQPRSLPAAVTWSTTLGSNIEPLVWDGDVRSLARALVGDVAMTPNHIPYAWAPDPNATACARETWDYSRTGLTLYPASITYGGSWVDANGAATCKVTGTVAGMYASGAWKAVLTGLGATAVSGFSGYTNENLNATVTRNEMFRLDGSVDDTRDETGVDMTAHVAYSGGLPAAGDLNGFYWTRNRDGGNWMSGGTPAFDMLWDRQFSNVTWNTALGVITFNGSFAVADDTGHYTVTLVNMTQGGACGAALGEPDGGQIRIENGVAAEAIVIDMTVLNYPVDPCGDAMVGFGGGGPAQATVFSGPVFF